MLVLVRKGNEVFYEGRRLTIVKQESKGPGNEVVKIDGLPESNGQKFISLRKLVEGKNPIECHSKNVNSSSNSSKTGMFFTEEEKNQYLELKNQLMKLEELGRSRYMNKPNPDEYDITDEESKMKLIEDLTKYTELKKRYTTL